MAVPKASAPRARPPAKAAAAAARRGLLPLVGDALLLGLVCALWAGCSTTAAAIAAGWAFGNCSLAAALAREASRLAFVAARVLFPLASPSLLLRTCKCKDRSQARDREDCGHHPSSLVLMIFVVCVPFMSADLLIQVPVPAKGFWLAVYCCGLTDIARFVASVTSCFGFLPGMFRHARALQD